MATLTYLPRVIPAFVVDKMHFGKRFEKFIKLIPYTAMAALVFPGVFNAFPNQWYVGVVGAAVAIVLSCIKKIPQFITIIASVAAVMIILVL